MTCREMSDLVTGTAMPVLANWVQKRAWDGLGKYLKEGGNMDPVWVKLFADPKSCSVPELKVCSQQESPSCLILSSCASHIKERGRNQRFLDIRILGDIASRALPDRLRKEDLSDCFCSMRVRISTIRLGGQIKCTQRISYIPCESPQIQDH